MIVSYPKSGSTWLRFLLANLLIEMETGQAGRADFLSVQLRVPEVSESARQNGARFEQMPSPRFLRTHATYVSEIPNAVYLLRDGRDVMVSYYFHSRKFNGFAGSFLDFLRSDCRKPDWDAHLDSWVFSNRKQAPGRFLLLRYEELISDTAAGVRKVLAFAGVVCPPDVLERAVDDSRFERMRHIERTKGLGYVDPGNPAIPFLQRGQPGRWREFFGPREQEVFNRRYGDALVASGYEASADW